MSSVYMGIDVACTVGKRLPFWVLSSGRLITPLAVPKHWRFCEISYRGGVEL
jgi:hypothetical protein